MNALITTYANIAMEGISIFYMLILLVACVLKKTYQIQQYHDQHDPGRDHAFDHADHAMGDHH